MNLNTLSDEMFVNILRHAPFFVLRELRKVNKRIDLVAKRAKLHEQIPVEDLQFSNHSLEITLSTEIAEKLTTGAKHSFAMKDHNNKANFLEHYIARLKVSSNVVISEGATLDQSLLSSLTTCKKSLRCAKVMFLCFVNYQWSEERTKDFFHIFPNLQTLCILALSGKPWNILRSGVLGKRNWKELSIISSREDASYIDDRTLLELAPKCENLGIFFRQTSVTINGIIDAFKRCIVDGELNHHISVGSVQLGDATVADIENLIKSKIPGIRVFYEEGEYNLFKITFEDTLSDDSKYLKFLVSKLLKVTKEPKLEDMELSAVEYTMKSERNVKVDFYPAPEMVVKEPTRLLILDGQNLIPSDLVKCEKGECRLQLYPDAEEKIRKSSTLLEKIASEHRSEFSKKQTPVYGVTTGFGAFGDVCIEPEKLKQLQLNLIRSHSTGYGQPLTPSRTRMLLALRINILAKGFSGIRLENIQKMIAAFNAFCVSFVPQQGTVGCSGDLAPLAHLALGLIGEGKMWSPLTGWDNADVVLKKNNLQPIVLGPKEGLALINGTQMVTSLGALAVERAYNIARQADVISALTLEALKGTTRAFDADIHRIRPHPGQILSALRLRSLLHSDANPSKIAESHRNDGKVQDAYSLRCIPQVHGIVHDTIEFVRGIITTEMNSATDNPLVFAEREDIISGGNFHGEYPAKALDYLAIGVHELAQISERRLERLFNNSLSGHPTFLTPEGGLNCGFMTVQLCAASLVSENKVLCHPSSVDSIPGSCNQEDHVSMGGFSARKALTVIEHVEAVLAMELLAACQAMEFLKPLTSTAPLNKVYQLVRTVSAPLKEDRYMHPDVEAVIALLRDNRVWEAVSRHVESYHS